MKCRNCGKAVPKGAPACPECGAAAADVRDEYKVTLCADGKYRWRYDASLYTNLSIYFIVWKIFFWIITAGFGIMALFDLINGDTDLITGALKMYGIIAGGMTVFSLLCYYIYALYMGGKYCV
ncbi:MAG: zinc ribbon domain-containing protein, partial [Clostridia bacterium]|nr:zinc ribbon domain-containing protein [Clostridia bacterium]